jgi:hypothetical protein
MATHLTLPAEVHDCFRKANLLHGYVQKSLGEATKHALETGQELASAKSAIPHGSWETECNRLFDGKLRTAQFYMQFTKDFGALKSAQKSALLMLEGTLKGAAKLAKDAARPAAPKPPSPKPAKTVEPPDVIHTAEPSAVPFDVDPPEETDVVDVPVEPVDYGKCPNCRGTKWTEGDDGVACAKCHHPHGECTGGVDDDRLATQRQKTVKTVEAAMRAFDDLMAMKSRKEHGEAIVACKGLLQIAKRWK